MIGMLGPNNRPSLMPLKIPEMSREIDDGVQSYRMDEKWAERLTYEGLVLGMTGRADLVSELHGTCHHVIVSLD